MEDVSNGTFDYINRLLNMRSNSVSYFKTKPFFSNYVAKFVFNHIIQVEIKYKFGYYY